MAPKLGDHIHAKSQHAGTKFQISCTTQQGARPFRFDWAKDGRPLLLATANNYRIKVDEDESYLTIARVESADGGNYSCTVSNQFGDHVQYTSLIVQGQWVEYPFRGGGGGYAFSSHIGW